MHKLLTGFLSLVFIPCLFAQVTGVGGSGGLTLSSGIVDISGLVPKTSNSYTIPSVWTFTTNGISLGCGPTPSNAAASTIKLFASAGCVPSTINSVGTVTAIGAGGGGGSSWTIAQPYINDGSGYFIPAANMASTNYTQGTTSFDSRPTAVTTFSGITNWGTSTVTPVALTNGNWRVVNTGSTQAFYLSGYASSTSASREISSIFKTTPISGGTGEGAGIAAWDEVNLKLYTMALYGTQVVIGQWCWNPGGTSCTGGVSGPVFITNLSVFPSPGGVSQFRISSVSGDLKFYSSLDGGGSWDTVDSLSAHSIGFNGLTWSGLYLADHTSMNVYTLGGLY